ncbi:ankyrin repeat domain-containing protein [Prosthecomicrobium sp. N25]|uniref:ankyrin repeat domain-containing protein n=1 Tax=Prosthecomicrobium sp. N25 TaxID=3129254 RepID=UPI00307892F7
MPKSAIMFAALTALGLAAAVPLRAAEVPTPQAVLDGLADRLYVIGETTGRESEFFAAVGTARRDLRAAIAAHGGGAAIAKTEPGGMTLLMQAAYAGHAEIVEELLTHQAVVAAIDATNEDGLSAWDFANFAIQETIWACNATVFADPFKYVPRYVQQPYYRGGAERPYAGTRRLLEAAGARADMAEARRKWLATCRFADAETRRKVAAGGDLLLTVEAEGARILGEMTARMAKAK